MSFRYNSQKKWLQDGHKKSSMSRITSPIADAPDGAFLTTLKVEEQGPEIALSDLPEFLQTGRPSKSPQPDYSYTSEVRSGDQTLDDVHRQLILKAMERHDWTKHTLLVSSA